MSTVKASDIVGMDDHFTVAEVDQALMDFIMKRHMVRLIDKGSLGTVDAQALRDQAPAGTGYTIVRLAELGGRIQRAVEYIDKHWPMSSIEQDRLRDILLDA